MIEPSVTLANQIRADRGQPPIRAHVTPRTLRQTYITDAIAAGFDISYVQAQVNTSTHS